MPIHAVKPCTATPTCTCCSWCKQLHVQIRCTAGSPGCCSPLWPGDPPGRSWVHLQRVDTSQQALMLQHAPSPVLWFGRLVGHHAITCTRTCLSGPLTNLSGPRVVVHVVHSQRLHTTSCVWNTPTRVLVLLTVRGALAGPAAPPVNPAAPKPIHSVTAGLQWGRRPRHR